MQNQVIKEPFGRHDLFRIGHLVYLEPDTQAAPSAPASCVPEIAARSIFLLDARLLEPVTTVEVTYSEIMQGRLRDPVVRALLPCPLGAYRA